MVAGGGPTQEQWEKMSRKSKTAYWLAVAIVFLILGVAIAKRFFF
jgi:hypothetical protein